MRAMQTLHLLSPEHYNFSRFIRIRSASGNVCIIQAKNTHFPAKIFISRRSSFLVARDAYLEIVFPVFRSTLEYICTGNFPISRDINFPFRHCSSRRIKFCHFLQNGEYYLQHFRASKIANQNKIEIARAFDAKCAGLFNAQQVKLLNFIRHGAHLEMKTAATRTADSLNIVDHFSPLGV